MVRRMKTLDPMKLLKKVVGKSLYGIYGTAAGVLFRFFVKPKSTRLVFISSPDYSDNGRILSDYILERDPEGLYEVIWLMANPQDTPKEEPRVRFLSAWGRNTGKLTVKALYAVASASYVFHTHGFPKVQKNVKKKPVVINLWHGCGYKDNIKRKGLSMDRNFDQVLVPGPVFVKTKSKFFQVDEEKVIPLGYPRYDYLLRPRVTAEKIRAAFDLNEDPFVLWMPTFREQEFMEGTGLPLFHNPEDLVVLDDLLASLKMNILLKLHKNVSSYEIPKGLNRILVLSNEELRTNGVDLYDLLPHSTGLITDYSSVGIDYLLLNRPIAFTLEDFETYKSTRGFVFEDPKAYMPGHHLYITDDFVQFMKDVKEGKDSYKEKREEVFQVTHVHRTSYRQELCDSLGITFKKHGENRDEYK